MFVLGFVFDKLEALRKSLVPTTRSAGERTNNDEEEPLLERSLLLADLLENEDGFSSEYVGWFRSRDASQQCFLHLSVYLLVAIIGYSFVFEDWPVTDSIYFAVVIFTTVGYGKLHPTSDVSRLFTIAFSFYGIVILGVFLGILGEWVIEKQEQAKQERVEMARTKILHQFSEEDDAAPPKQFSFLNDCKNIFVSMVSIFSILICMAIPLVYLEGWDPVMGLYWMVITGSTVGFGDLSPTSTLTKCIGIFYIPLAVAVFGELLGRIAAAYVERRNDEVEEKFLHRTMTLADLRTMDTDKDNRVSEVEFLKYMLIALQKVDKEDIDEIMDVFRSLDKSGTSYINQEDIRKSFQLSYNSKFTVVMAEDGTFEVAADDETQAGRMRPRERFSHLLQRFNYRT